MGLVKRGVSGGYNFRESRELARAGVTGKLPGATGRWEQMTQTDTARARIALHGGIRNRLAPLRDDGGATSTLTGDS